MGRPLDICAGGDRSIDIALSTSSPHMHLRAPALAFLQILVLPSSRPVTLPSPVAHIPLSGHRIPHTEDPSTQPSNAFPPPSTLLPCPGGHPRRASVEAPRGSGLDAADRLEKSVPSPGMMPGGSRRPHRTAPYASSCVRGSGSRGRGIDKCRVDDRGKEAGVAARWLLVRYVRAGALCTRRGREGGWLGLFLGGWVGGLGWGALLLCCFAALLLCCFAALLLCCFAGLLLCWLVALLACCFAGLLLCWLGSVRLLVV